MAIESVVYGNKVTIFFCVSFVVGIAESHRSSHHKASDLPSKDAEHVISSALLRRRRVAHSGSYHI